MIAVAIVLVCVIARFAAGESAVMIHTTSGPVRGNILKTLWQSIEYASFQGIRYGEPPVGYLRFKPPVPVRPWTDLYDATREGPRCIQPYETNNNFYRNVPIGSEDCLHLNVYTPVTNNLLGVAPGELKSVMVWIYGGAWEEGTSSTSEYSPDYLIERDVVVVSVNYRLGALGFLNLDHPEATGNAGLKDQVLALKWIRDNIHHFGGNPSNVTMIGCSTGAMSVGFHVLSEASAGLFHAGILMSGVPFNPWAFKVPRQAVRLAEEVGSMLLGTRTSDKQQLLEAYYRASPAELLRATYSIRQIRSDISQVIMFSPTLENPRIAKDPFMTECSVKKYLSGDFNKVPQLLGFMQDEMVSFAISVDSFHGIVNDSIQFVQEIGKDVPPILTDFQNSQVRNLTDLDYNTFQGIIKETSEISFISGIDQTQRLLSKYNGDSPVYYYRNTFYTNRSVHNLLDNIPFLGSGHADDVQFVFHIPITNLRIQQDDPIAPTIYRVSTMFSNFAKYGNPTPHWINENPLGIIWPDARTGLSLHIGNDLTLESSPITENVNLLEFYEWLSISRTTGCI